MPLYKIIKPNTFTTIFVWKISESYEELYEEVQLNQKSGLRLSGMKSQLHQRGFLSVRKLLQQAGYSDFDLFYDESGKPHLKDGKPISISHSHEFSAIIISEETVGIDIELQREKIIRIADKFVNSTELNRLQSFDSHDYIKKLTVKWGAKESIFKIRNEKGISFKNHIQVNTFELEDKETIAQLNFEGVAQEFKIVFEEFENFTLVYAFEN
ncbi:MAG: 4'-phosphopantetheinyl transferase superfamily protein [Flavobacterium sp.]|uniref:4'-phosphopantetheinyl transferase family protein n=1 Tax=Flavobacterium sp. TaxID=239 RepID=UPI0026167F1D|nr:4'-phosphopantetheinyl transferase superfamily protein [Flavobacterium sp.]MDD5152358.1 4'-phosphopantetheinyl transferase superfamily protein [Flavobacterium sp.]